ncbi:hypothetical protein [Pseudofrankia asymbiotica]|uniref:Uncharacterized protein n=1 Tax=Pseudofrankia asymbiotica TaxID=1834516 RepID=A0A1V2I902_9ACTN|nr:hypothetical protein [Pseudofrankia asymbiotica]ONH28977.1 hypothetical protein BL253_18020 [Pseudofrankia asymbiotica]
MAVVALLALGTLVGAVTLFLSPPPQAATASVVLRVDLGRDDAINAQFTGELLIYYARSELTRPGALDTERATDFQLAFLHNSTEPYADVLERSTIINIVAASGNGEIARNTVNAVVTKLSEKLDEWQTGIPDSMKIVLVTLPRGSLDPVTSTSYAGGSRPRAALGVLAVAALASAAVGTSVTRARSR